MQFGIHITIDGYGGNQELLSSTRDTLEIIRELMHSSGEDEEGLQLLGPQFNEAGAWGAFMISHNARITVHAYPELGHISIDLYPYPLASQEDTVSIHTRLIRAFGLQDVEVNALQRGVRFKGGVISSAVQR